jgi:hypothetical protein
VGKKAQSPMWKVAKIIKDTYGKEPTYTLSVLLHIEANKGPSDGPNGEVIQEMLRALSDNLYNACLYYHPRGIGGRATSA